MSDINHAKPEAEAGANRRIVLKTSLATLAALGTGAITTAANATTLNDADIFNFALNLEYLEAEYYLRAVFGTGLSPDETSGTGTQGKVNGGSMVPFKSSAIAKYATEIAQDEHDHVDFLRSALGANAVAEPQINLKASFDGLAKAAGLGDSFDPFASEENFLLGAFVFEDVGVTAYRGANITVKNLASVQYTAGIMAVEAYHAGIIRVLCYQQGLEASANKISALRNKLSMQAGSTYATDQGITVNGTVNLVPASKQGLAFPRDPAEVLNIVYAGGSAGGFGFFPHKMNGAIR